MNIKSVFFTVYTTFVLGGFFLTAPAQSAPMLDTDAPSKAEQSADFYIVGIEKDTVQEIIITPAEPAPQLDPYAVIEAARHSEYADEKQTIRVPLQDIQALKGRVNTAIIGVRAQLPEIKRVSLSPVEKLRDRLNQVQQTIRLKMSNLLESVGSSATNTAEQLRS